LGRKSGEVAGGFWLYRATGSEPRTLNPTPANDCFNDSQFSISVIFQVTATY
jgi:hypothetical protein